jgi:hypothetical protein
MTIAAIKNFTRYNTDDLTAIVQHVEQYVALHHGGTVSLRNSLSCLEFSHYSQGAPQRVRRVYNANTGQYENSNVKCYLGRTSYRNMERLSVVAPDHAFESELAFLAAVAMEQPLAPAAMVQAIGEAVLERYNVNYSIKRPPMSCAGLTLRIEGKVVAKKSQSDRQRERRGKAARNLAGAHYALGSAAKHIRNAWAYVATAKKHLKGNEDIVAELYDMLVQMNAEVGNINSMNEAARNNVAALRGGENA